jgi:cytosine permease
MTNSQNNSAQLPSYIASAVPNPPDKRAPWYKNTAPTYAGIFLWFVFWQDAVKSSSLGGTLSQGIGVALGSLVLAALICHFLFYLVPAMLGLKTGLPLYIVGTSTFGAKGGFVMPGFIMGVLQFGWLGVNIYGSAMALNMMFGLKNPEILMVLWGLLAAFMGLKGIQYVAKVASLLPIIPFVILLVLLVKTAGSIGSFDPNQLISNHKILSPNAPAALSSMGVLTLMLTYVVGFFATAGAAGCDFGSGNRDKNDVHWGGLVGVALAILFTMGISILIVAGANGNADMQKAAMANAVAATADKDNFILQSTGLITSIMGKDAAKILMFLLAITAFPSACFSSLIAANSFKTTLPKVNPFISVGIGAAFSILLAVTGYAGKVVPVFVIIGASFGPICGAMMVDYLLSGKRWVGPRAGLNPAGWIAWALGFIVGILPNLGVAVPAAPVMAFIVGAVVYFLCAKAGLQSATLPLTGAMATATKG